MGISEREGHSSSPRTLLVWPNQTYGSSKMRLLCWLGWHDDYRTVDITFGKMRDSLRQLSF